MSPTPSPEPPKSEFESLPDEPPLSVAAEFLFFIRENKKWWLIPILLVLGIIGVFALLAGTGAAPFIYTVF